MFMHAGGERYEYISALNDHPALIYALTELSLTHLQGWLNPPATAAALAEQVRRAKALGALD